MRDADALRRAFAYHPPYYHFDEQATNFVDFGMQNSRGFRALKVWLALRQAGASGYRRMISDDIQLSRAMASAVERRADLELVTQALSITTFRYVPPALRPRLDEPRVAEYLDTLNRELLGAIQRGGEVFVSNAVVQGRFVLRACIVNFHTTAADVEAVPEIVGASGGGAGCAHAGAGWCSISGDSRRPRALQEKGRSGGKRGIHRDSGVHHGRSGRRRHAPSGSDT